MTLNNRSNIILIGFMASGKSRIGEMLAKRLGYALFDVDHMIEQQAGRSIKEIFTHKGEWHFRKLESKVIESLIDCDHSIIVTGGGTPLCFDNASALKKLGSIFYLDANLALIIRRLKQNELRPLAKINHQNDLERLKQLYVFRRPFYLNLGLVIDVNHENKDKTCDEIIDCFKANNRLQKLSKIPIYNIEDKYEIFYQHGAIEHINDILGTLNLKQYRPAIVTSDRLVKILQPNINKLMAKLPHAAIITFGDGEQHKNSSSIENIHRQMFNLGLSRQSVILALGGGNVGDVAGFACAVYLRGVPFVQIPTTLLAMVDSSIGGKTGIDLSIGKNLVGSFYNPKAVLIDLDFLSSLPKDDFACGMAEIIKHAIIADRELFYALKSDSFNLETIIARAIKVKADTVLIDPKENNVRAHLNLGHTFAHAIEKVSHYQIKHGAAVAIGLVLATKLAKSLGILDEDFLGDLELLLNKFELPTQLPNYIKKNDLISAMKFDKKRDNSGLRFILPKRIGEVIIQYVDEKNIGL